MLKMFHTRLGAGLACLTFSVLAAQTVKADPMAYMAAGDGSFGTIDLQTGEYTYLGNSDATLYGLGVANGVLFATTFENEAGALFKVDPTNGHLTLVPTSESIINFWAFGSTTSGLYGIDADSKDLYSVNPNTGVVHDIGNTGISDFADWSNFSTGSSNLYFANGRTLYSVNTVTGAATAIGDSGGPHVGALVYENGTLYGGQNPAQINQCDGDCGPSCGELCGTAAQPQPDSGFNVVTLSTTTGLSTYQAAVVGASDFFFALAPTDSVSATPEPSTMQLAGISVALLFLLRRRIRPNIG